MTEVIPCGAHDLSYPQPHTCDNPEACAIESLLLDLTPIDDQLRAVHELLDEIAGLVANNKTKLAEKIRGVLAQ